MWSVLTPLNKAENVAVEKRTPVGYMEQDNIDKHDTIHNHSADNAMSILTMNIQQKHRGYYAREIVLYKHRKMELCTM